MPEPTQTLKMSKRPQFSLRALCILVTAVSVLLGVGCWVGWTPLLGFAYMGTCLAQGVSFWPVLIAILLKKRADERIFGASVLAGGTLLVIHLLATILVIEMLRSADSALDPIDRVIADALNYVLPSVATGLLLGAFWRRMWPNRAYVAGCCLAAVGVVGFAWYGNRVFSVYWGRSLSEIVWWL